MHKYISTCTYMTIHPPTPTHIHNTHMCAYTHTHTHTHTHTCTVSTLFKHFITGIYNTYIFLSVEMTLFIDRSRKGKKNTITAPKVQCLAVKSLHYLLGNSQ